MRKSDTPWPMVPIHQFCNPKQWPTIPQTAFVEEGYPVYGANGKIGFFTEYNHDKPTVLITCRGATCGTVNICEAKSYVTGNAMSLDDVDESRVVINYLVYALKNGNLGRAITGTAQPQITRQSLKIISVPIPPLSEQKRIASILDAADGLREKRRQTLAKLDSLVQSVFLDMFGDPINIQQRWPQGKLGDYLDFLTSGSRGWAKYYAESGALFIRIQNVLRDELVLDDVAYVTPPDTAEANRTRVQPGDVLLSITADLGRTAVVPVGVGLAYINQHLSILRTNSFVPRFLSAYFASGTGQIQVSGRNRQAVKAGLNFDDIRSFLVPMPPKALQREFARRVEAVEKRKSAHRASLAKLDALFGSLQQRAFKGELG